MLSNQIIQTNIDQLKGITKVDFFIYDMEGDCVASTCDEIPFESPIIDSFVSSQADSQIVAGCHFLKVLVKRQWLSNGIFQLLIGKVYFVDVGKIIQNSFLS